MNALGFIPEYMGVWGVGFTSRGAHLSGTDARVFFVQPNHVQAVDNGNTGEDPFTPFATIGAALLRCEDNRGDVILVGGNDGWQYGGGSTWRTPITETVSCTVEGVSILGVSADPLGVPWQPAVAGQTALTIQALGVEVAGFLFQGNAGGADTGVACLWNGTTAFGDNPLIHHCTFDATLLNGIVLEFSWNGWLHDLDFLGPDYGIYCDPLGSGFDATRIEDCLFRACPVGAINATGGCDNNVISRCLVFNADAAAGAAATNEGFDFTGGADNVVQQCTFSCALPVAAPGDYDDLNTAGTDAWIGNSLMNGIAVTNPT